MLLIAYGTRPEWLKIKPLIEELKVKEVQFVTLFTGQHQDLIQNDYQPDYTIEVKPTVGIDRLNRLLSDVISATGTILYVNRDKIKFVMVQGDTTSALAVALAAFNNGKKIIHLEAGLRTHDLQNPYPEEGNRQIISRLTSIHLCPTIQNEICLVNEMVTGAKYVVGNTGLDNLLPYLDRCEYENQILITLHRRENHDLIEQWFTTLNRIAGKYNDHKFILPIHPNPNVKKYAHLLTNITVIEPQSHVDLLNILTKCKFVITDSGGLQEECSFLGKKAIVCRKETERPEAIGYTTELCETADELPAMVKEHMKTYEVTHTHQCPFGDGHSAKKIVKILKTVMK